MALRLGIMNRQGTIRQPLSITDVYYVRDALAQIWRQQVGDDVATVRVEHLVAAKPEELEAFLAAEGPRLVINHLDQARFVGANLRALFQGWTRGGAVDWRATKDVVAKLAPAAVVSAPEVLHAAAEAEARCDVTAWRVLDFKEALRAVAEFDASTMTVLERCCGPAAHRRLQRCVIFGSHHASQVLAKRSAALVEGWRPQSVLLETDAERLSSSLAPERTFTAAFQSVAMLGAVLGCSAVALYPTVVVPLNCAAAALFYGWWVNSFACENVECAKASRAVGATVVLADWHWGSGRRDVVAIARVLDRLQYANQVNAAGSKMFLNALFSVAHPALAPRMCAEHWREGFSYMKEAQPHFWWVASARDDLLASCVDASADALLRVHDDAAAAGAAAGRDAALDKLVLVVGASHAVAVVDRLCAPLVSAPAGARAGTGGEESAPIAPSFERFFRAGRATTVELSDRNYEAYVKVPSVREQLERWP